MEAVRKFMRMLRRDYFVPAPKVCRAEIAAITVLMGVIGAIVTHGALLPVLLAAGTGGAAATGLFAFKREGVMHRKNDLRFFYSTAAGKVAELQGPERQVNILCHTQRLISEMTADYRDAPVLPADVVQKIVPYVRDAEQAARQVRAVCSDTGQEIRQMNLVRAFNGAATPGKGQLVAAIPLLYTLSPEEMAQERADAASRKQAEIDAVVISMEQGSARPFAVKGPLKLKHRH